MNDIDKMQKEVEKYFKDVLNLPCPDFRYNLPKKSRKQEIMEKARIEQKLPWK